MRAEVCNIDVAVVTRALSSITLSCTCTLRLGGSRPKHTSLTFRVEVDALLLGERGDRWVAHYARTSNGFNLATRCRSRGICRIFCRSLCRDVLFKVLLVAVKVFCAGQWVLEQDDDRQEHFWSHFSIDALELVQVDTALLSKHFIK